MKQKPVILSPNGAKDLRFFGLRPQNDVCGQEDETK